MSRTTPKYLSTHAGVQRTAHHRPGTPKMVCQGVSFVGRRSWVSELAGESGKDKDKKLDLDRQQPNLSPRREKGSDRQQPKTSLRREKGSDRQQPNL
eukprot:364410-Chlamydomonas_euryale.AAC.19